MAPLLKIECGLLHQLEQGIEQFEQLIEAEMKTHQDARLFTALPGAGKALAPRLLTAFGSNRERFQHADEVASMSGIAPITRQSGKSRQVVRRFACPNHRRQTFHEFANCARIWCPWSKAYYNMQRSRGMKHHAAVRKLAHRWIRILFQVWKTKTAYDPNR
jgi:transposase